MSSEYIVCLPHTIPYHHERYTKKEQVTFDESATTEHIDACVKMIETHGGTINHRFPDMMGRGFSYVLPVLHFPGSG
jgi:hypothetical protein